MDNKRITSSEPKANRLDPKVNFEYLAKRKNSVYESIKNAFFLLDWQQENGWALKLLRDNDKAEFAKNLENEIIEKLSLPIKQ